jgi:hypothetical protein
MVGRMICRAGLAAMCRSDRIAPDNLALQTYHHSRPRPDRQRLPQQPRPRSLTGGSRTINIAAKPLCG